MKDLTINTRYVQWLFQNGRFIPNAKVSWQNGVFTAIETNLSNDFAQFEPVVMIPGLVNLHAHLELTHTEKLLPRKVPFAQWVSALRQITSTWSAQDYVKSWSDGANKIVASDCSVVVDIGNTQASWHTNSYSGLKVIALRELIGLNPQIAQERYVAAQNEWNSLEQSNSLKSICAHAPYSCAPVLMNQVSLFVQKQKFPFVIHIAESHDEHILYSTAQGDFKEWLNTIYADNSFTKPIPSIVQYLLDCKADLEGSILVHGNTLNVDDWRLIESLKATVVHCPQSAAWFGHPQFDYLSHPQVAIATDSLASAESLSLWDQIALLQNDFSVETLLQKISEVPGKSLQNTLKCGSIQKGYIADWSTFSLPHDFSIQNKNPWIWLLQNKQRVRVDQCFSSIKGD